MTDINKYSHQIIITKSELPILRGGFANCLFFIIFVWVMIGIELIKEFNVPIIGSILLFLVLVYFIRNYLSFSSKIFFSKRRIKVIKSIGTINIDVASIERIKISGSSMNESIFLKLKLKQRYWPISLSIIPFDETNIGNYRDTLEYLEAVLKKYRLPYTKEANLIAFIKDLSKRLLNKKSYD